MPTKVEELKSKILEALQNGDIAALYVLEAEVAEHFDENMLHAYYTNILDLALENLTNTLESARVMNMSEVQDFATIRALYEYAMENYHAGKLSDASALFEVLAGLSNDKVFGTALNVHKEVVNANIELDDFLENYADLDTTEANGTFYISSFTKKVQNLLESSQTGQER